MNAKSEMEQSSLQTNSTESSEMEPIVDVDSVQSEKSNLDSTNEILQTEQTHESVEKEVNVHSSDDHECRSLQVELALDNIKDHSIEQVIINNRNEESDTVNHINNENIQDLVEYKEQDNINGGNNLGSIKINQAINVEESFQVPEVGFEDSSQIKEERLIDFDESYNISPSESQQVVVKIESIPVLFTEESVTVYVRNNEIGSVDQENNISQLEERKVCDNIQKPLFNNQTYPNIDRNLLHFDEPNNNAVSCQTPSQFKLEVSLQSGHQNFDIHEEIMSLSEDIPEESPQSKVSADDIVDVDENTLNSLKNIDLLENDKASLDILKDFPGDQVAMDTVQDLQEDCNQINSNNTINDTNDNKVCDVDVCMNSLMSFEKAEVVNISDNSESIDQTSMTEKINDSLQNENISDYIDYSIDSLTDKKIIEINKNVLNEQSSIDINVYNSNIKETVINIPETFESIEDINNTKKVTDNDIFKISSKNTLTTNNNQDSMLTENISDNNDNGLIHLNGKNTLVDDENPFTEQVVNICISQLNSLEKKDMKNSFKTEDVNNGCNPDNSVASTEKIIAVNDKSVAEGIGDDKHPSNLNSLDNELVAKDTPVIEQAVTVDITGEPLISNKTNIIDKEVLSKSNEKSSDISEGSVKDQLAVGEGEKLKNNDKTPMIKKSVATDIIVKPLISNKTNIIDNITTLKSNENISHTSQESLKVQPVTSGGMKSQNKKVDVDNSIGKPSNSENPGNNSIATRSVETGNCNAAEQIDKLQKMNWLRTQSSFDNKMNQNRAPVKVSLKSLPKKDERTEDYFEGTKRNSNNQKRNAGQNLNRSDKPNNSTSEMKPDNASKECNVQQSKNQIQESASTSSAVWNNNTTNKLFPNVQSVVIDRVKEEDELSMALAQSICTAQQENERRKIAEGGLKIKIQNEENDEWGKIRRNLPDDVPKDATNVNDPNNNQNPAKGFVDKYGRVDGYTEKHLFMGKGGRRREQEFLKAHVENKSQPNQSHPGSLQTQPISKNVSQETNSQHVKDLENKFDISKNKEPPTNTNQQAAYNRGNLTVSSRNQEPRSIHGRFSKEDSLIETNGQKPGFRQGTSKDVNQRQKETQQQNQNSSNKRNEHSERNQNYSDKNRTTYVNKSHENQIQPDRTQDSANKNQSHLNRQQNYEDQNRGGIFNRHQNYEDQNRSGTFNRQQNNDQNRSDILNRPQNSADQNRCGTYNKPQQQNYMDQSRSGSTSYKPQNYTDQNRYGTSNRQQNYADQNRNESYKRQEHLNRYHTDNRSHENANRNKECYNRNQNYSDINRETTNRSQNSYKDQNSSRNEDNKNKNQEENWDEDGKSNTNLQRHSNNTQQQTYNQRDAKYQTHDSKSIGQQKTKFNQQINSGLQSDKKSHINQNVDLSSQTNVKKEKEYVNLMPPTNNIQKEESSSTSLKNPVELNPTLNHSILSATAPTSTSTQIQNESQQPALKSDTGITLGSIHENQSFELRPNVIMSFEGNQNVQRALGLNPNICNPIQATIQNETDDEMPTSTASNPLNIPPYLNSTPILNQNLPTMPFSQQSVSSANFNPSIVLPNTAVIPSYEVANFGPNEGLQNQYVVGINSIPSNMPFEFFSTPNNNLIDQQLKMNEISNDSQELMRLHNNVSILSKQLAAAQAALLAAQVQFQQNHGVANPSNAQSQIPDLNIHSVSSSPTMQSQASSLPTGFVPIKFSAPPGFPLSIPAMQKSMVDDTSEASNNFSPMNTQDYLNEKFLSNTTMEQRLNLQAMYIQQSNLYQQQQQQQQQQAVHFQQYNVNGRGRLVQQNIEPTRNQRAGGSPFYHQ